MAEAATTGVREVRKFITRFQKLSFGGDAQEEVLSQHAQYDKKGRLLSEMRIDEFGHEEYHTYGYDEAGKLTEHHLSADGGEISETHRYDYDEKGRMIRQQKYYGDDPGEYTEYGYAAHEQPVSIRRYDSDGEQESEETVAYNEQDLPVEINKISFTGENQTRTVIAYNEQSLPSEKTVTEANGRTQSVTDFHYDEKGQLIRITEKNAEGKVISETRTDYDERGNVLERRIRDYQPRILRFAWDDHDNCTEESVHDEHGNLLQRSTYEFDELNRPVTESHFHMDVSRGSGPANSSCRYEYTSWD